MSEQRTCQNCKTPFIIEPEDFAFYEKISVPPPTFCPPCRMQRRLAWRNERTLYKRPCAATGKDVITMFAPDAPVIVYDQGYWWSDKWNDLASGRHYDFSKPFFLQFRALLESAPLPSLANSNCVRSEYGNHNADCKDCYLLYASFRNENVLYGMGADESRDSSDVYLVERVENVYESLFCYNCYHILYGQNVTDSHNAYFVGWSRNVNDCIGCVNLRNKSWHIWNVPYDKETYAKKLKDLDLGSYRNLTVFKKEFEEFSRRYPRRFANVLRSVETTGDNISNAKNCKFCFDIFGEVEDVKYTAHAKTLRDSYDTYGTGKAELLYEGIDSGLDSAQFKFTIFTHRCHDVQYTYACHNSSHLFACIGLRNKQYCILNKQYTREEYEALVPKIIEHMNAMSYVDAKGRVYKYGEFFPLDLSPFAYNETIAQEYFPLTRDQALVRGYRWKEPAERHIATTLSPDKLPDHIRDVEDSIVQEIIQCQHAVSNSMELDTKAQSTCNEQCTTAFKVIPQELAFYRKMNLPVPRLCPNCRHYARLRQRNPLKLWKRNCMCGGAASENLSTDSTSSPQAGSRSIYTNTSTHRHGQSHCSEKFETSYAPDRPEIVYCERCYNAEVV